MTLHFSLRQKLLAVVLLLIVFIAVLIIQKTIPNTPQGTSVFAPLDIVSGEVSTSDQKSVIKDLDTLTKQKLASSDLSIRAGSYKKTFGDTSSNFTVKFIMDISSAKSSYLVTIQTVNGSSLGPYEVCASVQKSGYSCTEPPLEGE